VVAGGTLTSPGGKFALARYITNVPGSSGGGVQEGFGGVLGTQGVRSGLARPRRDPDRPRQSAAPWAGCRAAQVRSRTGLLQGTAHGE
jgi:hypothetical protein